MYFTIPFLLGLVTFVTDVSCQANFRVVDLTHAHGTDTVYWPGDPEFNFTILYREQTQYYWYELNYVCTADHGGTHIDAPSHFASGQWRAQQIPIENLIGPGVVLNVKDKVKADPDYRVKVDDLMFWESKHGRIPKGAFVVMNSGWDNRYPNRTLTFGTDTPSDKETFHFPGFHEEAIDWLVDNRVVHVIGVDTPSTDYGQSYTFPVHVKMGKADLIGAENVAFLDRIPESGAMIYAAAIKLVDSSGGPARIFATFTEDVDTSSSGDYRGPRVTWLGISMLLLYTLN